MTRGERNNNPGNIVASPKGKEFLGEVGVEPEGRFGVYDTPINGIRALGKTLHTYITLDGCNTVAKVISRWAPPSDNNPTLEYIANVAKACGVQGGDKITPTMDILFPMVKAIIIQENGACIYTTAEITQALQLALDLPQPMEMKMDTPMPAAAQKAPGPVPTNPIPQGWIAKRYGEASSKVGLTGLLTVWGNVLAAYVHGGAPMNNLIGGAISASIPCLAAILCPDSKPANPT